MWVRRPLFCLLGFRVAGQRGVVGVTDDVLSNIGRRCRWVVSDDEPHDDVCISVSYWVSLEGCLK